MSGIAFISIARRKAAGGLKTMPRDNLKKLYVNARQPRALRHFKYNMARVLGFDRDVSHRIQDFTFGHFKQYCLANYKTFK